MLLLTLRRAAESVAQKTANLFGFQIMRSSSWNQIQRRASAHRALAIHSGAELILEASTRHEESNAQLHQDLIALKLSNSKPGFFIEFGAADGTTHSNTLILEKGHGWSGILVEPVFRMYELAKKHRSCLVLHRAVTASEEDLVIIRDAGLFSAQVGKGSSDGFVWQRSGKSETVQSISVNSLLRLVPEATCVDFLSIDTEGSEGELVDAIDFRARCVHFMAVEHNFTLNLGRIRKKLENEGFVPHLEDFWEFDSWWVRVCKSKSG